MTPEEKFETYSIEYQHGSGQWSVDVMATSFEDAEQRLRNIAATGRVVGKRMLSFPDWIPFSWAMAWLRFKAWYQGGKP